MRKTPPNSRKKLDEEKGDFFPVSPKRDWTFKLIRIVSFVIVFASGIVFGLSLTSHYSPHLASHTELFFPLKTYSLNCRKDNTSLESFVRPSFVMHGMNDDELFWRASLVPQKTDYPFNRVPKVAFMFMSRGPLPFLKLWEKFFNRHEGLYSIYVHTMPGYKLVLDETNSPFYGRQIPSEETSWGSITLIDAEKRLLANALLDYSNERFVLISESCIPVYNFRTIYNYLINSMHSFVESYDEDSPQGRGRYSQNMYPFIKLSEWRKGSEWFELSRELSVAIVADYKYYELFDKYCKPSCYPDEHYITTYLNIFHGPVNANRTVTWVDWSRGGPHPATYGKEAITVEFMESIRHNRTACSYNFEPTTLCYLFARKFAPNALEPLLELASELMEF